MKHSFRIAVLAGVAATDSDEDENAERFTKRCLGPVAQLVVEDDPKSAQLIRVQLEAEGFTVLCAARAEDALVLAVQQPLALRHSRTDQHHAPGSGEDVRRVATLSDGGVGVRVATKRNPTVEAALAMTGQHDRPTLNGVSDSETAEPEAPTALIAQKSPAPRQPRT